MVNILIILQVIVGILLGALILLQQRGAGVGGVFGGGGEVYGVKRGAERVMFIATIILAAIFLALGLAHVVVSSS